MLLITGRNGQLGTFLAHALPQAIATDVDELDITNKAQVDQFIENYNIKTIINCAAYTNVDQAEDEPDKAYAVNVQGPQNLAATGCQIIHISTDYVFDGKSKGPYRPDDSTNPLGIYGRTKLQGEQTVLKNPKSLIIRTAWLYSPYGKNFVKTMIRLGKSKEQISVVNDQIGSPTNASDLAEAIVSILPQLNTTNYGTYHYTNLGTCSWCEFAKKIMDLAHLSCRIMPIASKDYPMKATRPSYSVLDKTSIQQTFNLKIPTWQESLERWLPQIQKQS